MKIGIGADHRGFKTKSQIVHLLRKKGHEVLDYGTKTEDSVDYPDIAIEVAEAVASAKVVYGILLCHTGQGMVMAANKVRGVRAAFCTESEYARFARAHNDANVLVVPAGFVDFGKCMQDIIETFLNTAFEGGRHLRRINKIKEYEDSADRF